MEVDARIRGMPRQNSDVDTKNDKKSLLLHRKGTTRLYWTCLSNLYAGVSSFVLVWEIKEVTYCENPVIFDSRDFITFLGGRRPPRRVRVYNKQITSISTPLT